MANLNGTDGPDRIDGTADRDTIRGFGQGDEINGRGSADHLYGDRGGEPLPPPTKTEEVRFAPFFFGPREAGTAPSVPGGFGYGYGHDKGQIGIDFTDLTNPATLHFDHVGQTVSRSIGTVSLHEQNAAGTDPDPFFFRLEGWGPTGEPAAGDPSHLDVRLFGHATVGDPFDPGNFQSIDWVTRPEVVSGDRTATAGDPGFIADSPETWDYRFSLGAHEIAFGDGTRIETTLHAERAGFDGDPATADLGSEGDTTFLSADVTLLQFGSTAVTHPASVGPDGNDTLRGGGGADLAYGEGGEDRLKGGLGADLLKGGSDADRLSGGPGDDRLNGGPGDDLLKGGPGSDRFEERPGAGHDRIADFQPAGHHGDRVDVSDFFGSFAQARAHTSDGPDGAVVHLDAVNQVTLHGIHEAVLHADDFILA